MGAADSSAGINGTVFLGTYHTGSFEDRTSSEKRIAEPAFVEIPSLGEWNKTEVETGDAKEIIKMRTS